ncbi:hypothetical protein PR048_010243 [Dryococelus australis]|uniref:Uncharacterized protein n=1 Tax=Dryococelus australis TaxID=614101 RepID=A0ABQ9I284_9NEOP|nr:hypothetical protein PR048_010243 [Dryococelus australis]
MEKKRGGLAAAAFSTSPPHPLHPVSLAIPIILLSPSLWRKKRDERSSSWSSLASAEVHVFPAVHVFDMENGVEVAKRLYGSPPTKANRVQSPAGPLTNLHTVGIVPDDDACQRVFSGFSRFPRPCIPTLLNYTYLVRTTILQLNPEAVVMAATSIGTAGLCTGSSLPPSRGERQCPPLSVARHWRRSDAARLHSLLEVGIPAYNYLAMHAPASATANNAGAVWGSTSYDFTSHSTSDLIVVDTTAVNKLIRLHEVQLLQLRIDVLFCICDVFGHSGANGSYGSDVDFFGSDTISVIDFFERHSCCSIAIDLFGRGPGSTSKALSPQSCSPGSESQILLPCSDAETEIFEDTYIHMCRCKRSLTFTQLLFLPLWYQVTVQLPSSSSNITVEIDFGLALASAERGMISPGMATSQAASTSTSAVPSFQIGMVPFSCDTYMTTSSAIMYRCYSTNNFFSCYIYKYSMEISNFSAQILRTSLPTLPAYLVPASSSPTGLPESSSGPLRHQCRFCEKTLSKSCHA